MATRRYNIPLDSDHKNVTEAAGAAISSGAVQVTVDLAVVQNRSQVIEALDQIKGHIMENNWPPA